jgi:hypothetical protein
MSKPPNRCPADYGVEGLARLYQVRLAAAEVAAKDCTWRILCEDFFSRYVKPTDRMLDVAAGHCEFINHIGCSERFAYDANPDMARFALRGVILVTGDRTSTGQFPLGLCQQFSRASAK